MSLLGERKAWEPGAGQGGVYLNRKSSYSADLVGQFSEELEVRQR